MEKSEIKGNMGTKWVITFMRNVDQMVKHTFKILLCEHRKIFEVCMVIFQYYTWKDYYGYFI